MDTMRDAIQLFIFVSLPQTYIIWLFVLSFLRPLPNKLFKRVFILTVVHSVYTDIFILYIPAYLQLLNTLLAMGVILYIVFKELSLRQKIFIFGSGFVVSIIMDLIVSAIAMSTGIQDLASLRQAHLSDLLMILYPMLVFLVILSWFVRRRFRLTFFTFLSASTNERSSLFKLAGLILIQFVALAAAATVRLYSDDQEQVILSSLLYFTIIVTLAALVYMLRMLARTRTEAIRSTQAMYVEDINNMFTTVRGQRHDFLNHVQVIHTMAQMGKYEELREYTSKLVQETREVSDILSHTIPALAAFAKAKTTVALGYGIAFTCEFPERWNVPDTAINMLDLIKILANLTDNAFDEARLMPPGQRYVHLSIQTNNDEMLIEVANRGRTIDNETRAKMFQPGFTTKGQEHSGLGLAIIQDRVRYYGGSLDVHSAPGEGMTRFTIRIPYDRLVAI